MNEFISTYIIPALVGATSGGGIFVLLSNKWVSNWFEKDLKKYQNKLDILKIKDEIKFDVSHREMVNRISVLFSLLAELINDISSYSNSLMSINSNDTMIESYQRVENKLTQIKTKLVGSCIFLSIEVENKINDILKLVTQLMDELYSINLGYKEEEIEKEEVPFIELFALNLEETKKQNNDKSSEQLCREFLLNKEPKNSEMLYKLKKSYYIHRKVNGFNKEYENLIQELRDKIKEELGLMG